MLPRSARVLRRPTRYDEPVTDRSETTYPHGPLSGRTVARKMAEAIERLSAAMSEAT